MPGAIPDLSMPGVGSTGILSPVTVPEFLLYARIDTDAEDALLGSLLEAATRHCETYSGRKFLTQDCQESFDRWPRVIRPKFAPLASVESITYVDTSGATQTWSSDEYTVDTSSQPGRIVPAYGYSCPDLRGDMGGIVLSYKAGYGGADDVPQEKKIAIMQLAATWYEIREDVITGAVVSQLPIGVKALLDIDRIIPV